MFCIALLCVCILGLYLQKKDRTLPIKRFALIVYAALFFIVTTIISDEFDGKPQYRTLCFIFNFLPFIGVDLIVLAFNYYLSALTKKTVHKKTTKILSYAVTFATLFRIVLLVIFAATGNLFYINEAGHYTELELSYIPYLASGIAMLLITILIIINKKCFTTRQFVVILLYVLLPLIPVVVEFYYHVYCLTAVCVTISIIMIYVLIQDTNIVNSNLRAQMLEDISNSDLLTNMNNRRAYYTRLEKVKKENAVGVIFCDINGLKATNDKYGHAAGDKLIKRFANLIKMAVGEENVFRIAGDEFVVLLTNIDRLSFMNKAGELKELIKDCKNIAALGYEYGPGDDVIALVDVAEKYMYEDKEATGGRR